MKVRRALLLLLGPPSLLHMAVPPSLLHMAVRGTGGWPLLPMPRLQLPQLLMLMPRRLLPLLHCWEDGGAWRTGQREGWRRSERRNREAATVAVVVSGLISWSQLMRERGREGVRESSGVRR